jgi:exopolysaccharide biosynthesis predicted pyruvyltransferase EpsI
MNKSNIIVYSFNNKSYEILKNIINKEKLFFYPNFIIHLSNFFNYKNSLTNNCILIAYENDLSNIEQKKIENIILKYYENLNYIKTIKSINLNNLIQIYAK